MRYTLLVRFFSIFAFLVASLLFPSVIKGPVSAPIYEFTVSRETVTMPDGVRLGATMFMPVPLEEGERFPVLLKMDPYRKDDFFYQSDYDRSAYFARRGYVTARIDVRGTGASEGTVPEREYSDEELNDAITLIDQLSKKEWSNGNVGMYGMSWSAFNAIMTAMRKPPALKAIIAMHGSEDIYYNDIHFIDGVMHLDFYDQQVDTDNALPNTNTYDITEDYFKERFDTLPWFIIEMKNQRDSDFWRSRSLKFQQPLEVPAYVIGGLLDGYRDFAPAIFETSKAPVRMEMGPFNHAYPHTSVIGPGYEWRETAVRWWDYWLKGIDTGIMDEPPVLIFVRSGHNPSAILGTTPGSWRAEKTWPIEGTELRKYYLMPTHALDTAYPGIEEHSLVYSPGAGMAAGGWWGEPTGDMIEEDQKSLVYDSEVLTEDLQVIGIPRISITAKADKPFYQWSVRLEDVSPEGKVSLVSGALINPSQRYDRLNPVAIAPGEEMVLSAEIHFTTWTFKVGHRLRVAVTNAQFPMAWPTPYLGTTKLLTGLNTWLELPIPPKSLLPEPILPAPQEIEYPPDYQGIYGYGYYYGADRDNIEGVSYYTTESDFAWRIGEKDFASSEFYTYSVRDGDPARAVFNGMRRNVFNIPGKSITLSCLFDVTSDEQFFFITIKRILFENGTLIREKTWNETIPRDFQ